MTTDPISGMVMPDQFLMTITMYIRYHQPPEFGDTGRLFESSSLTIHITYEFEVRNVEIDCT